MTSLRFEYQTTQDSEMFKQVIHTEDKARKEFRERHGSSSPIVSHQRIRECLADAMNGAEYLADSTRPNQQTVQLFSKKMKRIAAQSSLPPLTHHTLSKCIVQPKASDDDLVDKPNVVRHASSEYVNSLKATASTQTSTPRDTVSAMFRRALIPQPPPMAASSETNPPPLSASALRDVPAPGDINKKGTGSAISTSVFSRGSSSLCPAKKNQSSSDSIPKTPSFTGSRSTVGGRTTSTQREKLRSMTERLSRMEEKIEASIVEEVQVTKSLEELKELVLSVVKAKN